MAARREGQLQKVSRPHLPVWVAGQRRRHEEANPAWPPSRMLHDRSTDPHVRAVETGSQRPPRRPNWRARKQSATPCLLRRTAARLAGPTPSRPRRRVKKTNRGLDLSQLDATSSDGPLTALNASGIDNALDALSLTASSTDAKIDRHPERRFKAAYAAYEERRLAEMEADGTGQGLRLNQKKEKIKKEFEKSPDNPFNQVTTHFNTTKNELSQIKEREYVKIESRLGEK